MERRTFLRGLSASLLLGGLPLPARARPREVLRQGLPALPILMFHKVDDAPRYPEDVSSGQLQGLLAELWKRGYRPVNMSDILENRVDSIVPKGMKPVGITADDSHRSVVFSRQTAAHSEQRNALSLVEILGDSLRDYGYGPRATFFLSGVGDDRYSTRAAGYFGGSLPLPAVLDALATMPGLETGYHTLRHTRMKDMGPEQVRAVMEEQMRDFARSGVLERVSRILAYPYGVKPTEQGIYQLREMGFKGAVLAYPGTREARYQSTPPCVYDGQLMTDPFLIPRVCIGARTYAPMTAATAGAYAAIEPLDDFHKDVEETWPQLYVSRGPKTDAPS